MLFIKNRSICKVELNQVEKNLANKGYAVIKNFFTKKSINDLLTLTKYHYELQKKNIKNIKTPKVWNSAKIIYNLQNKDLDYIKLIQNKYFEKILVKKINDPHYRSEKSNKPNYILNHLIARSSGDESLFLHIDSGIPTGEVTTFVQIMIVLEKSTKENGCTVIVPGSHLSKKFANRKVKKFDYLEGDPGDVFIWDGNLWHGSLPNNNENSKTRWAIIATYCNWQFKQVFDIPRAIPISIYKKLNNKEKMLLGFCSIPALNEQERVTRSITVKDLKKNQKDYYRLNKHK